MDIFEKYPTFECLETMAVDEQVYTLHKTITVTSEHRNAYTGEVTLEVWCDYKEAIPTFDEAYDALLFGGLTDDEIEERTGMRPVHQIRDVMSEREWRQLYAQRTGD